MKILRYVQNFIIALSHTGTRGNDQVGKVSRSALSMVPEKTFKIPYTDLKIKINKYILQQWQQRWSNNNYNKLPEIKPILAEWKQSFRKIRKEVVISRLRIGHKNYTFLLA